MSQQAIEVETEHRTHSLGRRVGHFLRHLGEMALAMMVGMAVLGWPLRQLIAAVSGGSASSAEVRVLAMGLSMGLPMAVWMRFRRHSWASTFEMAGVMIVPAIALYAASLAGLISGATARSVDGWLMTPSMIAVMLYRRREYAG